MAHKGVLVVDDDEDLRDTISEALADQGYPVAAVANGQQALDWLGKNPAPGLILLDLMMPIMNGWDFLAARARDSALSAIPVVVVSASHAPGAETMQRLAKPVSFHDLISTVAQYCGGSA